MAGRHAGQQSAAGTGAAGTKDGGSSGSARRVAAAGQDTQQTVLMAGSEAAGAQAAALGGSGSTNKAAAAGEVQQQQEWKLNFSYDPVQQLKGAAATKDTPPPQRRPGFQAAENANQAKYDKMWTGSSSYQKGSCWGCRFVGDIATKLDFHTVLDAGTGEDGDC